MFTPLASVCKDSNFCTGFQLIILQINEFNCFIKNVDTVLIVINMLAVGFKPSNLGTEEQRPTHLG